MKVDPRSDKVALYYTGSDAGEPSITGVPARDLTENDIARLVYVEHGDLSGAAHQNATAKLVDTLTDGPYRRTAASVSATKKPAKKPESAAPATPPVSAADASDDPPAEPSATTPKEA